MAISSANSNITNMISSICIPEPTLLFMCNYMFSTKRGNITGDITSPCLRPIVYSKYSEYELHDLTQDLTILINIFDNTQK